MKAKHRKIAAIAAFATCMVAMVYFLQELLWVIHFIMVDDLDPLDITGIVVFGIIMFVFLGLYLSFKKKNHMF